MTNTIGTCGKWKIKATYHAGQRMKQRKVSSMKVTSAILAFGEEKLNQYAMKKVDIVIIDKEQNIHIVFTVKKTNVTIITVVDGTNVFTKNYPDSKHYEI